MDDELANIRAKADELRARGWESDKRFEDLMERLISDNGHSAKIREWLRAVQRGRSLEQQVTIMASLMAVSGRRDEWDNAPLKVRKAHADKLSAAARTLADTMGEAIRPRYLLESYLYSVGFKAEPSARLDFPALLEWLSDHVGREADVRETTRKTRERAERIFTLDLAKKLDKFYGESPNRVIAACVSLAFPDCKADAGKVASWLGRR